MSMRIAIGGFQHESHSFAPLPTRYADFIQPGGFPGLVVGEALIPTMASTSVPIAGAMAAAKQGGATMVPLAWCIASPAGPVQDTAFERIAAQMCAELSRALDGGPLDGVYLDLHGAALADSFPDAEGELLRRVRAIVGPVPIAVSLDPHANVTRLMVDMADVIVPYRTYPHVDQKFAGARAMTLLLAHVAQGASWVRSFRQLDFWMPLGSQCTLMPPMADVLAERAAIAEAAGDQVIELGFCFGFPYADFPDCGASITCYATSQAMADDAADRLRAFIDAREARFGLDVVAAGAAVTQAMAEPVGPVVLADTQDNPGGGGHGDTTGLLGELIRQGAEGAVVCLINDAESAAVCHAAGEGETVALALGGKSDATPLAVTATVLRLTEGRFSLTGPMGAGNPANLGPTALIGIGGVRVMVVSRKMQALDLAILRHVGIEPAECRIIALKSSVHFRADFGAIASRIIVAISPGPVVADPAALTFSQVRPDVRHRPAIE